MGPGTRVIYSETQNHGPRTGFEVGKILDQRERNFLVLDCLAMYPIRLLIYLLDMSDYSVTRSKLRTRDGLQGADQANLGEVMW